MSYQALRALLRSAFADLNEANVMAAPQQLWDTYGPEISRLSESPELEHEFTDLSESVRLPRTLEAMRSLQDLRQRFTRTQDGTPLVGRVRAEVVLRQQPKRDVARSSLAGHAQQVADVAPESFAAFSEFQTQGWLKASNVLDTGGDLVIVAPTGGGKTEVFLLPVIQKIAQALREGRDDVPRVILLYPRVALLKDQLGRVLRYVHQAERSFLGGNTDRSATPARGQNITVGFQFRGIAANAARTRENRQVFGEDGSFRVVEQCPVCGDNTLKVTAGEPSYGGRTKLRCNGSSCRATFTVSIAKEDHARSKPHLLVTTVESLDQLYLMAKTELEGYLRSMTGVVFDEAHLYESVYGAHVHNIVRRIDNLRSGKPLAKIAASATISRPERFAAKLFHGDEERVVEVHSAADYEQEPNGLEVIYFLQSPDGGDSPAASRTLIQSVMALGHGVLHGNDKALVFTESLDLVGRLHAQIGDADGTRNLWSFRTQVPDIYFSGNSCPRTNPVACEEVYHRGECWRGMLGGEHCHEHVYGLRERALNIVQFSSQQQSNYWGGEIVVSTSALEVGLDDDRIKATVHYRPPRTVSSFIQRRGRAGRGAGDSAYTLMVLGTTPSDHFYFFRRNRLVHGTFDLPLNPQNPVVAAMHERLEQERNRMRDLISQHRPQVGIWRWLFEKLYACPILRARYGTRLLQFDQEPRGEAYSLSKRELRAWVRGEKQNFENFLSLRWVLNEVENESPDELGEDAREALDAVKRYLLDQESSQEVGRKLRNLNARLGDLRFDEEDRDSREHLRALQDKVLSVWDALSEQQAGVELEHAERLYDFFRKLEDLFKEDWKLSYAPDTMKIVLQAMFYLHLGMEEGEEPGPCRSRTDYFVPDTYFQEVRPVIVEARRGVGAGSADRSPDLEEEDMSSLASLLIPYNPIYRYFGGHPYLSVLDVASNPASVDRTRGIVTVSLRAEGVHRGGYFSPQKVSVKALRTDEAGRQIMKICPECFTLYSENRGRRCHNSQLRPVRLYTEPLVEREYSVNRSSRVTGTLSFAEDLLGSTTVFGSSVEASPQIFQQGEYFPRRDGGRFSFEARYESPIRYQLSTKGITWDLAGIVDQLLDDEALRSQVEQESVAPEERKTLDSDLVLHTAAHILQKAVAAISGVNEQVIEYDYDPERREVAVWERQEGGVGISDTFVGTLLSNPLDVYKEMLASVLCPVNLAESPDWTSPEELHSQLFDRWCLPSEDFFLENLVREAQAERRVQEQHGEETHLLCRPPEGHDGCPACLHATHCTRRDEQTVAVSRLVGEAVLASLVRRLDRAAAEAAADDRIAQDVAMPLVLGADNTEGAYDVLLL